MLAVLVAVHAHWCCLQPLQRWPISLWPHATRNAAFLEELADVDALTIDKSGTLTLGRLHLVDSVLTPETDYSAVLQLAAALGATSSHPVSHALAEYVKGDSNVVVERAEEKQGLGGVAITNQGQALLGRADLFATH